MESIAQGSVIFDVSIGSERTFLMQCKETGAEESILMRSGSAVVFTTTGNALYKHAVLPEPGAGPRVSIVFRNIKTTITAQELSKRLAKMDSKTTAQKRKGAPGTLEAAV